MYFVANTARFESTTKEIILTPPTPTGFWSPPDIMPEFQRHLRHPTFESSSLSTCPPKNTHPPLNTICQGHLCGGSSTGEVSDETRRNTREEKHQLYCNQTKQPEQTALRPPSGEPHHRPVQNWPAGKKKIQPLTPTISTVAQRAKNTIQSHSKKRTPLEAAKQRNNYNKKETATITKENTQKKSTDYKCELLFNYSEFPHQPNT